MNRQAAEWMVKAAHLRQVVEAQRRSIATLRRRTEKAEADVSHYVKEYEGVLRLCRLAGFNPYYYENVEGSDVSSIQEAR